MSAPAIVAVRDAFSRAPAPAHPIAIALLGLGQIGAAVARLVHEGHAPARLTTALVRDVTRTRPHCGPVDLTRDIERVFASRPDVIVEVLGGVEPARTFVRTALERGIPVVTANKTLIARHGEELLDVAVRTLTPFRYEASVLAGVPFLGTFAARPLAARVSKLVGIVNGTSNYVLSRATAGRVTIDEAMADAQRLGFAEPDPADDVNGIDAAHKLAVLAWHFGLGSLSPGELETRGLERLHPLDLAAAGDLGGSIKPVASIEHTSGRTSAFIGPAFVPGGHRLAGVTGVENALLLDTSSGRLFFSGPGAGPIPTAATILDDVVEASRGAAPVRRRGGSTAVIAPSTPWLLRVAGTQAGGEDIASFLGAYGIWVRRAHTRDGRTWRLTYACSRERIDAAVAALTAATACDALALRALED
jgi:homoserine dehydrogenase